jgi:hypothetical protein
MLDDGRTAYKDVRDDKNDMNWVLLDYEVRLILASSPCRLR